MSLSGSGATAVVAHPSAHPVLDNLRPRKRHLLLGVGAPFMYILRVPWLRLRAARVRTVLFQSEPLGTFWDIRYLHAFRPPGRGGRVHTRGGVDEIWDYSKSNILTLRSLYNGSDEAPPVLRHVPPGYLRSVQAAYEAAQADARGASQCKLEDGGLRRECPVVSTNNSTIVFVGDTSKVSERARCLASLEARVGGRRWVRVARPAWDEREWAAMLLASNLAFLNLHKKGCARPPPRPALPGSPVSCAGNGFRSHVAPQCWPVEAFRFALLLSVGATIFSERSHPADEATYTGLAHFAPFSDIATAAVRGTALLPLSSYEASARATAFARRFAPLGILERAGIDQLLGRGGTVVPDSET